MAPVLGTSDRSRSRGLRLDGVPEGLAPRRAPGRSTGTGFVREGGHAPVVAWLSSRPTCCHRRRYPGQETSGTPSGTVGGGRDLPAMIERSVVLWRMPASRSPLPARTSPLWLSRSPTGPSCWITWEPTGTSSRTTSRHCLTGTSCCPCSWSAAERGRSHPRSRRRACARGTVHIGQTDRFRTASGPSTQAPTRRGGGLRERRVRRGAAGLGDDLSEGESVALSQGSTPASDPTRRVLGGVEADRGSPVRRTRPCPRRPAPMIRYSGTGSTHGRPAGRTGGQPLRRWVQTDSISCHARRACSSVAIHCCASSSAAPPPVLGEHVQLDQAITPRGGGAGREPGLEGRGGGTLEGHM